jgi:hypothetical protein
VIPNNTRKSHENNEGQVNKIESRELANFLGKHRIQEVLH